MNNNDDHLRWVTVALCSYEITAIVTEKVPTISRLSARYKWLGPVLVGTLTAHLYQEDRRFS